MRWGKVEWGSVSRGGRIRRERMAGTAMEGVGKLVKGWSMFARLR